MSTLSICMIVKNEEKHLTKCLSSVKDIADEIVVVDTGSTDTTLHIAREFNSSIFHFKWNNDFASARNFALSKCQSDWILYLDADEELNNNSIDEIQKIIHGNLVAFNCIVKSLTANVSKFGLMKYPRLFPNDKRIKFEGKVHEQIQTSLDQNKIPLVDSTIEIIHYGYILNEETASKKLERNLNLLKSGEKNNPYEILKLAQTLHGLKRFDEADKYFIKLVNDKSIAPKIKGLALLHYAILLFEKNEFPKSLEMSLKGFKIIPQNAYLNYLISSLYLKTGEPKKAFQFILNALENNLKLTDKNEISESEIISDQTDLYLRAINLAIQLNEIEKLNSLISYLSIYLSKEFNSDEKIITNIFLSLLTGKNLSDEQFKFMISIVKESNLISFLELFRKNQSDELKEKLIVELLKAYPNSAGVKKHLANIYIKSNPDEAEKYFFQSLEIEEDSSVYFNLISLYIGKRDYESVKKTFQNLSDKFSNQPMIKPKIAILKEKLKQILDQPEPVNIT